MTEGGHERLFPNWKSDSRTLHQFFEAVVANYKRYEGKRSPAQIFKSHALYKQAVYGDCNQDPPSNMESREGLKWKHWSALRHMPPDMAKRRWDCALHDVILAHYSTGSSHISLRSTPPSLMSRRVKSLPSDFRKLQMVFQFVLSAILE